MQHKDNYIFVIIPVLALIFLMIYFIGDKTMPDRPSRDSYEYADVPESYRLEFTGSYSAWKSGSNITPTSAVYFKLRVGESESYVDDFGGVLDAAARLEFYDASDFQNIRVTYGAVDSVMLEMTGAQWKAFYTE